MSQQLPIPDPSPYAESDIEREIGNAIAMWNGVCAGHVDNPRGLSQREFIADRLSRHFTFVPRR
jgi:hypothetical protein